MSHIFFLHDFSVFLYCRVEADETESSRQLVILMEFVAYVEVCVGFYRFVDSCHLTLAQNICQVLGKPQNRLRHIITRNLLPSYKKLTTFLQER